MKSPLFVLASLLSGSLLAAAELTSLGPGLTPVGAEQQGNAAGTIPAWEGGLTKAPPGFTPGAHHPDPFPEDPILFTVTAKNLDTHRAQLGPGLLAMFGKYPGLLMHVYPTRRSAAFPQRIYQMTLRNAEHGQMLGDGEGVAHVSEGFPFPLPKTGAEVIWNHRLKYKGSTVRRWENLVTPSAAGAFTPVRIRESMLGLYFQKDVSQATQVPQLITQVIDLLSQHKAKMTQQGCGGLSWGFGCRVRRTVRAVPGLPCSARSVAGCRSARGVVATAPAVPTWS